MTCPDGSSFWQENANIGTLEKLEPVHNAWYKADHHDKCLPETRKSILQEIMRWARDSQDQSVFWLNGLAGTGKSTVAQSFSEMAEGEGILGASFFCSRDYPNRRELKNIFQTLAYQLAWRYSHFRRHIVGILDESPAPAHTSLISQLENLLVNPLSGKNISCIIVIDAVDECIDNDPTSAILSVLGRFIKRLSPVKFFITGRPELRIRDGFRLHLPKPLTRTFLLHEVERSDVDKDIQLYLRKKLAAVTERRNDLTLPWPRDDQIVTLTEKASGLFIFASTFLRFIDSGPYGPNDRLRLVLSEANSTTREGSAGIDALYFQILPHVPSGDHELEVSVRMRRILGAIVLAFEPLPRRELSTILDLPVSLISDTLDPLHSVIHVPDDESKGIRVFHKSFRDFLQDGTRCTNLGFYIEPSTYHGYMGLSCLDLVKRLERNPYSLPPFMTNPQSLENKLGSAVRYACSYWARHLELSPTSGDHVHEAVASATKVLESAPQWIEVMSLENRLEEVIHSMHGLLDWLDKVSGSPSPPNVYVI